MSRIKENIEELTTQILIDNDMLYKIPVDVIEIAKIYNIEVYEGELSNKISGAIRYNRELDRFEILVNKKHAEVRQRFTIAHELGHYFLHQKMLKNSDVHIDILYRADTKVNEETRKLEKEVDYFAGALLINRTMLNKMSEDYTIEELTDIFSVSGSAMTVRLDILGLL